MSTDITEPRRDLEPYRVAASDVLSALNTDPSSALSSREAAARLERFGRNELESKKPLPGWRKFRQQFANGLIVLRLVAGAISTGLWLYQNAAPLPYEALAIFIIVLLNATMGYAQQARAAEALAALRRMTAAEATVVRDGENRTVPAAEIVPGDILLLEEGDRIPADARLIESVSLETAEAALTGGSL